MKITTISRNGNMENSQENRLKRAKTKVSEIKKYRQFVATSIFVAVCLMLLVNFLYTQNVPQMVLWIIGSPVIVFGIILFTEYIRVFDRNPIFNKEWEARQIQKYINEKSNLKN